MKKLCFILLVFVLGALCCISALADANETEPIGEFVPIGIGETPKPTSAPTETPDTPPAKSPAPQDAATPTADPNINLPFVDVDPSAYYAEAVRWAYENKITSGMDDTHFSPDGTCTRAQFVTLLWRMAGEPDATVENPFTDVARGEWYYNAVLWAVEQNVTSGVTADRFDPNGILTRAQVVTFLYRVQGEPEAKASDTFSDVEKGSYYEKAVYWAAEREITFGVSSTSFAPNHPCTRAQAVTFLYRFVGQTDTDGSTAALISIQNAAGVISDGNLSSPAADGIAAKNSSSAVVPVAAIGVALLGGAAALCKHR